MKRGCGFLAKEYAVVCYLDGKKLGVAGYVSNREEALKMADVLNKGAQSNPRSRAVFVVEEVQ